jgi:carboxymethylenebutenolidase
METALTESWSSAATADGPIRLFVARPDAPGPFPGLVVLQEIFGVNDHIQDVCRRYAALGYVVAAPDLFHRLGVHTVPYSEIDRAKELLAQLTDDQVADDIGAALGLLKEDPGVTPGQVAVTGYCYGGRCAYLAATRFPEISAAVAYYGGQIATGRPGALVESTDAIRCPVLAHFGEEDTSIPPEQIQAIDVALTKAGARYTLVTHLKAGHAFACDARPANFQAEAAAASWDLTSAFLGAVFEGTDPVQAANAVAAALPVRVRGAA